MSSSQDEYLHECSLRICKFPDWNMTLHCLLAQNVFYAWMVTESVPPKCCWAPNCCLWPNHSPSPLAGVVQTELQSCPMGEQRSIVESGQTRTSKKGDSIPNAPSAEPLTIIVHTFLPLEGDMKENGMLAHGIGRGGLFTWGKKEKGGLKKDDDAWSRESNHVIIFERWEKIIFFSFPHSPLLFFILFPQSLCAECIKET